MLAQVAMAVCLCLSQVGVLSKRLNGAGFWHGIFLPPIPPCVKKVNSRIFASNTRNLVQNSGLRENFATAGLLIVEKFHVCDCNHKFCCEIDVINLKDTRRSVLFQICQNKIFWQLLSVTAGLWEFWCSPRKRRSSWKLGWELETENKITSFSKQSILWREKYGTAATLEG